MPVAPSGCAVQVVRETFPSRRSSDRRDAFRDGARPEHGGMHDDPEVAVEEVHDLPSLISFIGVLNADWERCCAHDGREPGSPHASMGGWENGSIGAFLDAMRRWSIDSRIHADDGVDPYQLFAYQLLAGKTYE